MVSQPQQHPDKRTNSIVIKFIVHPHQPHFSPVIRRPSHFTVCMGAYSYRNKAYPALLIRGMRVLKHYNVSKHARYIAMRKQCANTSS